MSNTFKLNMTFYDFENIIEKIEMEYTNKDFRRLSSKSSSGNTSESEASEVDFANTQGISKPVLPRSKNMSSSKSCCELFKLENVHSSAFESEFSKDFKCPKKLKKELRVASSSSQKTSTILQTTEL